MELNVAETLKKSLFDGFIIMFNTPILLGNITLPLWTILLGILIFIITAKTFKKLFS